MNQAKWTGENVRRGLVVKGLNLLVIGVESRSKIGST